MSLKIKLTVFAEINMLDFERQNDIAQKYDDKHKNGIYFFAYGGSSIPYYIGSSRNMFTGRVPFHIAAYRRQVKNVIYWVPRKPEKLVDLSCFLNGADSGPDEYFSKKHDNYDHPDYDATVQKLLQNTQILFSYLTPEDTFTYKELDCLRYDVEMYLYMNLVKRMGLQTGWVGDGGIQKDFASSLRRPEQIHLSMAYECEPKQRLNEALLI